MLSSSSTTAYHCEWDLPPDCHVMPWAVEVPIILTPPDTRKRGGPQKVASKSSAVSAVSEVFAKVTLDAGGAAITAGQRPINRTDQQETNSHSGYQPRKVTPANLEECIAETERRRDKIKELPESTISRELSPHSLTKFDRFIDDTKEQIKQAKTGWFWFLTKDNKLATLSFLFQQCYDRFDKTEGRLSGRLESHNTKSIQVGNVTLRYVEAQVSSGAMGHVHRAWLLVGEQGPEPCAVKIADELRRDPKTNSRLKREGIVLEKLLEINHPNIAEFKRTLIKDSTLYVITELSPFVDDNLETADKFLRRHPRHLPSVVSGIINGLHAMHQAGYAHGDIKANNVLMFGKLDMPIAKIADFGQASHEDIGQSSQPGGAHFFAAPEIIRHRLVASGQYQGTDGDEEGREVAIDLVVADVWSFAATVVQLITDQTPFPNLQSGKHWQPPALFLNKLLAPSGHGHPSEVIDSAMCDYAFCVPECFLPTILGCWKADPSTRITMAEVLRQWNEVEKQFEDKWKDSYESIRERYLKEDSGYFKEVDDWRTKHNVIPFDRVKFLPKSIR